MTVGKLLHTRYRVNDLEETVKFYTEVLGLKETKRHKSGRGSHLVFLQAPGSEEEIEICYYPDAGEVKVQEDLTHLAFEVEDMEAFGKHAEAKGYPFSDGPSETGSGSVIAFIDGPDGYEFELIQKAK